MTDRWECPFCKDHALQWRTIDSAPRDGTWFLGYYNGRNWGDDGSFSGKHNCVVVSHNPRNIVDKNNPFKWETFGPSSFYENMISHWMPLPQPPNNATCTATITVSEYCINLSEKEKDRGEA